MEGGNGSLLCEAIGKKRSFGVGRRWRGIFLLIVRFKRPTSTIEMVLL